MSGMFFAIPSHILCYCVITQYSLTKINGGDRWGMFLAVCHHVFLITVLLHGWMDGDSIYIALFIWISKRLTKLLKKA